MKNKKKIIIYTALVIGLILGGYKGVLWYQHMKAYESTDDAQIDGNVIPVIARVGSYINQVKVKENQNVQSGELIVLLDSSELSSKLNQTKAGLESAEAQLEIGRASCRERV